MKNIIEQLKLKGIDLTLTEDDLIVSSERSVEIFPLHSLAEINLIQEAEESISLKNEDENQFLKSSKVFQISGLIAIILSIVISLNLVSIPSREWMKLTTEQRHLFLQEQQGIQNFLVSPEEFDLFTQNWNSQFFYGKMLNSEKTLFYQSAFLLLVGVCCLLFAFLKKKSRFKNMTKSDIRIISNDGSFKDYTFSYQKGEKEKIRQFIINFESYKLRG
jgi:hypothetical protein